MAEKAPFVSKKFAEKKRRTRTLRRIVVGISTVLFFALLWWFAHTPLFQIKSVVVEGTSLVPKEEVQTTTEAMLGGSYIFFFPKSHYLWYPKTAIKKKMLLDYPRIATIVVSRKSDVLHIAITERQPKYLWCGATVPDTSEEAFARDCYFTDQEGYIFATAPNFSDAVYIKLYATIEHADEPLRQTVFKGDTLRKVEIFAHSIKSDTIVPHSYVEASDNDIAILLLRAGGVSPRVLYNSALDPMSAVTAFRSAISTEPLMTKLKKSFSTLEYIDVRFDKKVFYKFGETQKTEQTANGTASAQ